MNKNISPIHGYVELKPPATHCIIDSSIARHRSSQLGRRALSAAIASNVLFGLLFLFSDWMSPLSGTQVYLWRMPAMLIGLLLMLTITQQWQMFLQFLSRLKDEHKLLPIVLTTPILASQFWLYMWGSVNGYGVDVAMGYFLFPLAMVVVGKLVLKEQMTPIQMLAIACAAVGVTIKLWQTGHISWATLWVCGTYPVYYLVRRKLNIPVLFGLTIDLMLITPFCLGYLIWIDTSSLMMVTTSISLMVLVILLGIFSAAAMGLNLYSSDHMSYQLFGVLSYLEPTLMFLGAYILLDTSVSMIEWISYIWIWVGLGLMCAYYMYKYYQEKLTR